MGMGMGIVHVVLNVHVCINVCPEFLPQSNGHLPMKLFQNPLLSSSRLSSHMGRVHLEDGCCRKSTGFCNGAMLEGDGLSTVEGVLIIRGS